ncbi:lipoprotein [Oleiphilus sp. HI0079]|jgi:predicted small lipoprotein YifL|uniref:LPS translocon maturation chaperone LptM n=1 Tax=unclassified Oleiphilus TaxID=2631174 RepID=UPI0009EDDD5B|nr:lipoprotein [Oleiphilus sp. HI0079]
MLSPARLVLAILFITVLSACGQKGALYMPSDERASDESTEQSQSEPSLEN